MWFVTLKSNLRYFSLRHEREVLFPAYVTDLVFLINIDNFRTDGPFDVYTYKSETEKKFADEIRDTLRYTALKSEDENTNRLYIDVKLHGKVQIISQASHF